MIILITGTRTGVGRAMATHLLDEGHHVVGCSRRPATIEHERYRHHQVDLTDERAIRSMCRTIRGEHGRLDGLVNNAGTSTMNHFRLTPPETARAVFDINFFAVLNCCREAVKLLEKSEEPAPGIVTLSTVAVPWALDGQLIYSASKSAVEQLVRVMSKEIIDLRIRINGIGLPPVPTVLSRSLPAGRLDELVARQTIKRMCTMEDIMGPTDFLLSRRSQFITGETIFLGGVG